jgi:plastocyanin
MKQEVLMSLSRFAAVAALSLAVSFPTAAQPAGQTIFVWSYGFAPNPIHLAAGRPVTLTFVNRSGSSHDFVAKSFFGRSTVTGGAAPEGEIDLPPHATRIISLIPRAGRYSAHCSHFFHKQLGMSDQILVD